MVDSIQYPQITRCKNGERKSEDNLNFCRATIGFVIVEIYNQNSEIVEFEIECPWCGTIWWLSAGKQRRQPRLYKKRKEIAVN